MRKRPYQKLVSWKESHALCAWTYQIVQKFPIDERFSLVRQMCRSAASVATNLAEGSSRKSAKERYRFFEISIASLEELHYQFLLAKDLEYISEQVFKRADDHIQRTGYLIGRLQQSLI